MRKCLADVSREARGLDLGLGLHLHPNFMYASSESTHTYRLDWVFAVYYANAIGCEILCRWPIIFLCPMKSSILENIVISMRTGISTKRIRLNPFRF